MGPQKKCTAMKSKEIHRTPPHKPASATEIIERELSKATAEIMSSGRPDSKAPSEGAILLARPESGTPDAECNPKPVEGNAHTKAAASLELPEGPEMHQEKGVCLHAAASPELASDQSLGARQVFEEMFSKFEGVLEKKDQELKSQLEKKDQEFRSQLESQLEKKDQEFKSQLKSQLEKKHHAWEEKSKKKDRRWEKSKKKDRRWGEKSKEKDQELKSQLEKRDQEFKSQLESLLEKRDQEFKNQLKSHLEEEDRRWEERLEKRDRRWEEKLEKRDRRWEEKLEKKYRRWEEKLEKIDQAREEKLENRDQMWGERLKAIEQQLKLKNHCLCRRQIALEIYRMLGCCDHASREKFFNEFSAPGNRNALESKLKKAFTGGGHMSKEVIEDFIAVLSLDRDGIIKQGNAAAHDYTLEEGGQYVSDHLAFQYYLDYMCERHSEEEKIGGERNNSCV